MNRVLSVSPKYVWLTSGTGEYGNQCTSMCMAKRSAGIENVLYIPISQIGDSPFVVLDRKEFIEKSELYGPIYMYGVIQYGKSGERIMGSISAISTDSWGGIAYNCRYGKPSSSLPIRSEMSSIRQVVADYERVTGQQSPKPLTVTSEVSCEEDLEYTLIVSAMVLGEPDV